MAHFDSLADMPPRLRDAVAKQLEADDVRRAARKRLTAPLPPPTRGRPATTEPLSLFVPCKPWSLNIREHHMQKNARVQAVRSAVVSLVTRDVGQFVVPVEIEATTCGARLDALNDALVVKGAVDGLRDAGVLVNDDARFVRRYIMNAPEPEANPGLQLIVRVYRPL